MKPLIPDIISETESAWMRADEERLLFELEQSRQDDREAGSRIVQVIIAGVAALAFLLAFCGSSEAPKEKMFFLVASLGVVSAAFSYIASIGILATLRYRHLRTLEKAMTRRGISRSHPVPKRSRVWRRLVCGENELDPRSAAVDDGSCSVGWVELSSSINTLNASHIRSSYSAAHFLCVVFGALSAAVVCILIVAFFASEVRTADVMLLLVLFLPVFLIFTIATYAASFRSKELYIRALGIAKDRRLNVSSEGGLSDDDRRRQENKRLRRLALYLVYPRPRDVLKTLFVVVGVSLGAVLGSFGFIDAIWRGLLVVLVVDCLLYQARYQWNDIRGIAEDRRNPVADIRGRLPVGFLEPGLTVRLSAGVAVYKLLLAVSLIVFDGQAVVPFGISALLIFVLAGLYEWARARGRSLAVIALVGLGYPVRIFAGAWAMFPGLFETIANGGNAASDAAFLLLLLAGTYFFGLSFVGLTWAHEGACFLKEGKPSSKGHVRIMSDAIGAGVNEEYPLRTRGKVFAPYNNAMIASVVLMILAETIGGSGPLWMQVLLVAFPSAVFAASLFHPSRMVVYCVLSLIPDVVVAVGWVVGSAWELSFLSASYCMRVICLICLSSYVCIYVWFRNTNYAEMNNSFEKIRVTFTSVVGWVLGCLLGKSAGDYIRSHDE